MSMDEVNGRTRGNRFRLILAGVAAAVVFLVALVDGKHILAAVAGILALAVGGVLLISQARGDRPE